MGPAAITAATRAPRKPTQALASGKVSVRSDHTPSSGAPVWLRGVKSICATTPVPAPRMTIGSALAWS